jgi:hypothetical protein
MLKKIGLLGLLLIVNVTSAIDTTDNTGGTTGARARGGLIAASTLIAAAGDRYFITDVTIVRGQRPWNNTPAQDCAKIAGCLKVLGVGAVAITGAVLIEYMRMQSICHPDVR